MFAGTLIFAGLALALGSLLVLAARYLASDDDQDLVVERIEQLLPRIQCGQCGYPGCRPYASAIAAGEADINRCPPGGEQTVRRLANLLGRPAVAVDYTLGHADMGKTARIDEPLCIGCGLCVEACPVDAIVGVPQMMHAVLQTRCTGCELCIAPCPMDCIDLVARRA